MQGRYFLFSVQAGVKVGDPERLQMWDDDDDDDDDDDEDEKLGLGKEGDREKDKFHTAELNHRAANHLIQDW